MRLTINSSYAVFTPKQNETDVEFKFNNIETDEMDEGKKKNGGFPGGLVVKNLPANAGDTGLIPGPGIRLPMQET